MDKRLLSERDICSKFVLPALIDSGWDLHSQIAEERTLTAGRIIVRGKLVARGQKKRADFFLYLKANVPIAVIEAKDNRHVAGDGIQQALTYAEMLQVPFAFSLNGDSFIFHDRSGQAAQTETEIGLDAFPSPQGLRKRFLAWKGMTETEAETALHLAQATGA